jgi:hypothetical protein
MACRDRKYYVTAEAVTERYGRLAVEDGQEVVDLHFEGRCHAGGG